MMKLCTRSHTSASKQVATATSRLLSTSQYTTPLSQAGGVHGNRSQISKNWRNKPLFRRTGDQIFKTGTEACQMLNQEAARRSPGMSEFLNVWEGTVNSLSGVFDRMPKYAWIMKQMLEPERTITFRVAWIDDAGISRTNRGYRVQYSSAMGPYEGGTTFNSRYGTLHY